MTMQLHGRVAVITGAGSGFGREFARLALKAKMPMALADIEPMALAAVVDEIKGAGGAAFGMTCDVSQAAALEDLAEATMKTYGAVHLVFNNAGVGSGGLIWENSLSDWNWVLGVNLYGVVHGIRSFVPRMLACAAKDPSYHGHIVNTASMAGMLNAPNMGIYNVSKHAVVALTETLYQDLRLIDAPISASVLCPYFVPTGISASHRNAPSSVASEGQTASQKAAAILSSKAVSSGKVTAHDVALRTFEAIEKGQFYVFSHPHALGNVQTRMEDILTMRNPSDPFAARPDLRENLRQAIAEAARA
jgi:NAD(P)-dependent dehydrogenase (short-subunit alcohol dehydrogenase family)